MKTQCCGGLSGGRQCQDCPTTVPIRRWPAMVVAFLFALFASWAGAQPGGNWTCAPLANAARTTTAVSADQLNTAWRGIHLAINVTPYTSGAFTPVVQGKDALSGAYYTILSGTMINAAGTTIMKVYPGLTTSASSVANDIIPRTWRVMLNGFASPIAMTLSVGCSYAM